jgi:hypothetical protein
MFDFMFHEAGKREIIYHGESAYWVKKKYGKSIEIAAR